LFVSCVVDESVVDNNSSCWGILGIMCAMIFGAWRLQGLHKVLTNNVKALSFERRGKYGRRKELESIYLSIPLWRVFGVSIMLVQSIIVCLEVFVNQIRATNQNDPLIWCPANNAGFLLHQCWVRM
jgi:hypothetical protein